MWQTEEVEISSSNYSARNQPGGVGVGVGGESEAQVFISPSSERTICVYSKITRST